VVPDHREAPIAVVPDLQGAATALAAGLRVVTAVVVQDPPEAVTLEAAVHPLLQEEATGDKNLIHNDLYYSNHTGYRIFHILNKLVIK
jgi:hypothetical protein